MKSLGYAKQEAKCDAVDNLRTLCAKENKVIGIVDYGEPTCTSEIIEKIEYFTCETDVWSYCQTAD